MPRIYASDCSAVQLLLLDLFGEGSSFGSPLGTSEGPQAVGSNVYAYNCEFEAGPAALFAAPKPGVRLTNGAQLFASSTSFQGEDGTPGLELGAGDPTAFLVNCVGSTATGSGTITSIPGAGGLFLADSPLREGEAGFLHYQGLPGDLVLVGIGLAPAGVLVPPFAGALLHAPVPPPVIFVLGVAVSSTLHMLITVPALAPGVSALSLFPQAGVIGASGDVMLVNATALTLLDASL